MCSPSATLTVWAGSWLAGHAAPDDVLSALHAWADTQSVLADPALAEETGLTHPERGATALLKTLRGQLAVPGAELRLVLPVAGDVRGLPAGSNFATAAIAEQEGLLAGVPGSNGVGIVPTWMPDGQLRWTVYPALVPLLSGLELSLGEAEHSMREAVREAAEAMAKARGVAVGPATADPRALVDAELAGYSRHLYPDSTPVRARRVFHTADHVAAILTVAQREKPDDELLRPLWGAIRSARLAAARAAVAPC